MLICRFLAALGIGGEWAVGASLLSETWPKKWRVWIAAILQTGVNLGVLAACVTGYVLANQPERYIFLVGVLPAFIVFWVRKNVPEPDEWHAAKSKSEKEPGMADLFRGNIRHITLLTSAVCALTLTGWWAFMFWHPQHLRSLPELASWTDAAKRELVAKAFFAVVGVSIAGNFFASGLARLLGYRRSILCMCLGFFAAIYGTYSVSRGYESLLWWLPTVGFFSGVFGLFTMYLPPLFPTLLRTTGAGFCFNIGRIAAACGTVLFLKIKVDFQTSLMAIGFLFLIAAVVCLFLPELSKAESERRQS